MNYLGPKYCRVKVREGRIGEITEILAWYEYINDVILDHLDDEIKSTDRSGVWRYLISFKATFSVTQLFSVSKIYFSESSPCHREYWHRVRVWDPLPDHGQRDAAELHQVRGARHSHLGVPQLLHPPGPLPGEKVQENLFWGGLQILQTKVNTALHSQEDKFCLL